MSTDVKRTEQIGHFIPLLDGLVVRIPACHAGGRGSIPRQGDTSFL